MGQQSQTSADGNLKLVNNINVQQVMAWKYGLFIFNDVSIDVIMRQLTRWYNIEVKYKGKVNARFFSTIPRNATLAQVLETLKLTKAVRFTLNGRELTVIGQE